MARKWLYITGPLWGESLVDSPHRAPMIMSSFSSAWTRCGTINQVLGMTIMGCFYKASKFFITFNSSPPRATYMHQWIGSALVQIMACRLFGAKLLSKPMLGYCQLDPQEETSVKLRSKYKTFHSRKCIWKYHLWNGGHFVQGEMS